MGLVDAGASADVVAAATLRAARRALPGVGQDPCFERSFWLLTQVTEAAQRVDFVESLRKAGLKVPDSPTLFDITSAFSGHIDQHRMATRRHTDVGEMAQFAATEALTSLAADRLPTLFGTTTQDVQSALRELSGGKGFGRLTRGFLARFLTRYLSYYLSREMSNHVGVGRRFSSTDEHTEFNSALRIHCLQVARIAEEFAGGWLGKTRFEEGAVSEDATTRFVHVALKKVSGELARG